MLIIHTNTLLILTVFLYQIMICWSNGWTQGYQGEGVRIKTTPSATEYAGSHLECTFRCVNDLQCRAVSFNNVTQECHVFLTDNIVWKTQLTQNHSVAFVRNVKGLWVMFSVLLSNCVFFNLVPFVFRLIYAVFN